MWLLKGNGQEHRGMAADIPSNMSLLSMPLLKGKWYENTGRAADIP